MIPMFQKFYKNSRQKISSFFVILVVISGLLSACSNEYFSYHSQRTSYAISQEQIKSSLENWQPDTLSGTEVSIFSSPSATSLDRVVKIIGGAKRSIELEVYMLSEKRIIQALKYAKSREINVRVILEPNPYGNPYINRKTYTTLKNANIDVVWADDKRFVFTHAKFLLVDEDYLIMTANMTHSAFTINREFFSEGRDAAVLRVLREIFDADYTHVPIAITEPDLAISPLDSRKKLEGLILSAHKQILLYTETFDDENIKNLLFDKAKKGVQIEIILADPKKITSNRVIISAFAKAGIQVMAPKKPTIHAKVLVIDEKIAYIGSINFTKNSIEKNREIGIIFKDSRAIADILKISSLDAKK